MRLSFRKLSKERPLLPGKLLTLNSLLYRYNQKTYKVERIDFS